MILDNMQWNMVDLCNGKRVNGVMYGNGFRGLVWNAMKGDGSDISNGFSGNGYRNETSQTYR